MTIQLILNKHALKLGILLVLTEVELYSNTHSATEVPSLTVVPNLLQPLPYKGSQSHEI